MTTQPSLQPTRAIRLGTILVHRGILQEDQVQRVLLEPPELLALTAKLALPERLVLRVKPVLLEPMEPLALLALLEQVGVAQLV